MTLDIDGLTGDRALAARIRVRLGRELRRLTVTPVSAVAAFVDDDGPKGGPARRCALTVRLPYRPALRAEESASTDRLAFDGAMANLERQLERYRERQRERGRRPKKYYAAKRLL
ncbi:MAG TPA: HPF/RaiA family ribosome-associated protein [Methylomirabilota bacterium]|nr:HPF/RaiA family ribosome-associated protein [Methylomirabilota bacterium]